jgi:hypothetical protein
MGIGVIMAVLGMETSSGDFEVIDLCFAGLPEIYVPPADPTTNGKGKAKATDAGDMEVDGKHIDPSISVRFLTSRGGFRKDMGRNGFWVIYGRTGSRRGRQGRDDGRVVDRRSRWSRGMSTFNSTFYIRLFKI